MFVGVVLLVVGPTAFCCTWPGCWIMGNTRWWCLPKTQHIWPPMIWLRLMTNLIFLSCRCRLTRLLSLLNWLSRLFTSPSLTSLNWLIKWWHFTSRLIVTCMHLTINPCLLIFTICSINFSLLKIPPLFWSSWHFSVLWWLNIWIFYSDP